jgi:glycerophosphoryl diester phosphodiesterase
VALRFPFLETAIVAHRGAHCCGRRENSLSAIAHAAELTVPGIEIDVCNLSDGELVLSHDPYVTLAGATVPLPALTVPDVMPQLRAGELVLANGALELVRSTNAFLCLDWKGYGDEARIVQLIHEFGLTERTIVSSHRSESLARIKGERPGLLTGLSLQGTQRPDDCFACQPDDEVLDRVHAARADAAMLERGLASPALLNSLRDRGAGVFVWTAKDAETFATLADLAPDGIMSDVLEEHPSDDWSRPRPSHAHDRT